MSAYARLLNMAKSDQFVRIVDDCFRDAISRNMPYSAALEQAATQICELYPLSAEVHRNGLVFYSVGTRAAMPPAIVVSGGGASMSPGAFFAHRTAWALIQVFDAGAVNERNKDGLESGTAYRLVSKDRELVH